MILAGASVACGSDGSTAPEPVDADVCGCPGAGRIQSDLVLTGGGSVVLPGERTKGVDSECLDTEVLMSGSCYLDPLPQGVSVLAHSPFTSIGINNAWRCGWDFGQGGGVQVTMTVTSLCMKPDTELQEPDVAPPCECPLMEQMSARVQNATMTGAISAQAVSSYQATCPDGHYLIGGYCDSEIISAADFWLVSSGPSEDLNSWSCTWRNNRDRVFSASVKATCVRPVTPDTALDEIPLSEQAPIVSKEETLSPDGFHSVEAVCPPGKHALWGGCVVTEGAEESRVRLARIGFLPEVDNNPNVWHCTWNNEPSGVTTKGKAFATCVDPAEDSRSLPIEDNRPLPTTNGFF